MPVKEKHNIDKDSWNRNKSSNASTALWKHKFEIECFFSMKKYTNARGVKQSYTLAVSYGTALSDVRSHLLPTKSLLTLSLA